jgi:glycosyltransferase involved in cell wall biosynthesis
MRILNINSYYYSSSVHRQLQKSLKINGVDTFTYVPLTKGYVPRSECIYGDEKHVLSSECYNEFDRYIFHLKHNKILGDIKQRINLKDFTCMHAHSLFSNGYIAMRIKEEVGTPYIVAVRATDLNLFFKYMVHLKPLGKKILNQADKIIFLSETYRDFLIERYVQEQYRDGILKKSVLIPNGIDDFWLNNKGPVKQLHVGSTVKLIHVGVISKRKNLSTTVKAVEFLKKKGYEVLLTVVGRVVDESIFNQIKKLPYVKYIPPVSKEELIKIYRENDVFVMPSITETFGLVYPEAMSQGLPVLYTKGQGFDGQFDDGEVGYSVNCFDAEEIADKIICIMKNYSAISERAIVNSTKFDWNILSKEYKEIYNSLLMV